MKSLPVLLGFIYSLSHVQTQSLSRDKSTGNSSLTFQSATSRSKSPGETNRGFPFIIPYNQTQECKIFGPICQTGSVTVAVDLTSTTTTTTMPCSSYLTSQSSYISNFNSFPGAIKPFWPSEWKAGFGHSPECSSYANVWENQGKYTFSNCGSNDAVVPASLGIFLPPQIPPGVLRQIPFQVYKCCANCTLDVPEVRLYYFRDETGNNNNCPINKTPSSQNTVTTAPNEKRAISILNEKSNIAVVSGYTFTSPSVYLEIVGTARVTDSCGPLGAVLTNPIVALPPNVLATYSPEFPYTTGEKFFDPNGVIGGNFIGYKKSLKIADLECPTFGVGLATGADGEVYRTYGPPYLPIIIPPLQILSLDPTWQKICTDFLSYSPGLRSFAIFDPPRILTPVAGLSPPATPAPAIVSASKTPDPDQTAESRVQPSRPTSKSVPKATVISVASSLAFVDTKPSVKDGESHFIDAETASFNGAKLSVAPTTAPGQDDDSRKKAQNLGALILSAFSRRNSLPGSQANTLPPLSFNDQHPSVEGQKVSISDPSVFVVDRVTQTAGGAAAVLPAEAGNSDVEIDGILPIVNPLAPHVLTVAGQTFTANPSGISIAGTTILPGGPGITISGTPISLAQSGTLFLESSPIRISNDPSSTPIFVFTIGGQTATAHPTGFALADSEIVPGGAPMIVSGTRVSLGPSGILVIGDSSVNLLVPTPTSNVFTVGSQRFTANPTGFALAGSPLLPGGAPIIILGTPVSLAASGVLVIGSLSIALPTPPPIPNIFTANGLTFTAVSSAIIVDGTTLLPGGVAATISGTPISLKAEADSNVLIIGTSSLHVPAHSTATNIFTIAGLTFTSQSSGVVVDGSTLVPGGSAATISGTLVSLEAGGRSLVVGSQVLPLATTWPTATGERNVTAQSFEGGQARGVEGPRFLLVAGLLVFMGVNFGLELGCGLKKCIQ